jgi:hypothetical protein
MKLNKDKLVAQNGYFEGTIEAVDKIASSRAIDYKNSVIKNYISISPEQIDLRLGGEGFFVTRKYDGELAVIFYDGGDCAIINRSGRVRTGLACTDEAAKLFKAAGIKQAIVPAELYVDEKAARTRVYDVLKAFSDPTIAKSLRLAPFEILELDNSIFKSNSYENTHKKLQEIFKDGICQPVRGQAAASKKEVDELYHNWVSEEGAEGLVVRTGSPLVYKVKPRYTVDVAVLGFSEGTADAKGQVRSLLIAMMDEEGKYQLVGRTGNGMSDEFRVELLAKLTPLVMPSKYIETDSNHVAFRMIKPEIVIEMWVSDIIFESTTGPTMNTILQIKDGEYVRSGDTEGFGFIFPIFERIRDDKTVNPTDVRIDQISSFAAMPEKRSLVAAAGDSLSALIHRELYVKESKTGDKIMVQKYMVWKTNKEDRHDYPAYVLHYTNYSSDRKEHLQREVRVSNDEKQIMALMQAMIDENVKKGWVKQG